MLDLLLPAVPRITSPARVVSSDPAIVQRGRDRERFRRWYAANRDKHVASVKEWREANPEKVQAWREKALASMRARNRRNYLKRRAAILAKRRAHYQANRERILAERRTRRAKT